MVVHQQLENRGQRGIQWESLGNMMTTHDLVTAVNLLGRRVHRRLCEVNRHAHHRERRISLAGGSTLTPTGGLHGRCWSSKKRDQGRKELRPWMKRRGFRLECHPDYRHWHRPRCHPSSQRSHGHQHAHLRRWHSREHRLPR